MAYLTVQESCVDDHVTRGRPGLHIAEPTGVFADPQVGWFKKKHETPRCSVSPAVEHRQSLDDELMMSADLFEGGIYFATNTNIQVFDALVNRTVPGMVDQHDGCEHVRPFLGPGTMLQKGELVWMTESTPHEELPHPGPCQYFRLVMPYVSRWYSHRFTANPRVTLPHSVTVDSGNSSAADGNKTGSGDGIACVKSTQEARRFTSRFKVY